MFKIFFTFFSVHSQFLSGLSFQNYTLNNEFDSVILCSIQIVRATLFWRPTLRLKGENATENGAEFNKKMAEYLMHNSIPLLMDDSHVMGDDEAMYLVVQYFDNCHSLLEYDFNDVQMNVKYLFIIGDFSRKCENESSEVKSQVGKFDVSFFVKENHRIELATFIPEFDKDTCEVTAGNPKIINVCKEGKLEGNVIFPIKNPSNMNKCPLKIGMSALYPLSMIENKESLKNYDRLYEAKGADVEIMKIVTEYFNATMEMYYVYKVEENPYIEMEFLNFLLNGSLEICAGGMYRIFGDIVEYSGVYARQTINWAYTADRPERSWINLIDKVRWFYIFLIFYITYSVVWYFIGSFDGRSTYFGDTLLNSLGALTGTTSLETAVSLKQKILNITYMFMCLHLSVFLSMILYSFLTISVPPELFQTNDQLMNSGRIPYLKQISKIFMDDDKYSHFVNKSENCDSFYDCTVKSLQNKGITVLIPAYLYHFQAVTAVNDEAIILAVSESILTVYYEMLINKYSPLVVKFRKVVERLFEAGITYRLFEEAIGINVVEKAMITSSKMASNSYSCQSGCSISLKQFYGTFVLWMLGCILSSCVFILELLKQRKVDVKVD